MTHMMSLNVPVGMEVILGIMIFALGFIGSIILFLNITAWMIDKLLRLLDLHRCFIDFMFDWVKKRREKEDAALQSLDPPST